MGRDGIGAERAGNGPRPVEGNRERCVRHPRAKCLVQRKGSAAARQDDQSGKAASLQRERGRVGCALGLEREGHRPAGRASEIGGERFHRTTRRTQVAAPVDEPVAYEVAAVDVHEGVDEHRHPGKRERRHVKLDDGAQDRDVVAHVRRRIVRRDAQVQVEVAAVFGPQIAQRAGEGREVIAEAGAHDETIRGDARFDQRLYLAEAGRAPAVRDEQLDLGADLRFVRRGRDRGERHGAAEGRAEGGDLGAASGDLVGGQHDLVAVDVGGRGEDSIAHESRRHAEAGNGEAMADGREIAHACPALGRRDVADRHAQVPDAEPPQRSHRVVVARFLAQELVHRPVLRKPDGLGPGMAQEDADRRAAGALRVRQGEARPPRDRRRRLGLVEFRPVAADVVHDMAIAVHIDDGEAELLGVVPSVLVHRLDAEHLRVVLAHEGRRHHHVELGPGLAVIEDVVHVPREYRFHLVPREQGKQLRACRLVDVVVGAGLVG